MLCACVLRYILVILIPAIIVFTAGARVLKHAKDINPSDTDGAVVRIAVAAALCVMFIPQLFRPLAELVFGCIGYAPKKWNERKLKRERAIELLAREAEFEETHSLVATAMSGDKYRIEKGWVATGADIHGMHPSPASRTLSNVHVLSRGHAARLQCCNVAMVQNSTAPL